MNNIINHVLNFSSRIYLRVASAMFLVLMMAVGVFAQSEIEISHSNQESGTFKFEKKEGSHTAQVVFKTRDFSIVNHKSITVVREQTMVDGRLAYGTDLSIPNLEIESMRFYLDGKEIKVPKRLYADCFDPNFDNDLINLKFGPDLQSLMITMHGSDGAGGYDVTWILKKNGQHRRSVKKSEY